MGIVGTVCPKFRRFSESLSRRVLPVYILINTVHIRMHMIYMYICVHIHIYGVDTIYSMYAICYVGIIELVRIQAKTEGNQSSASKHKHSIPKGIDYGCYGMICEQIIRDIYSTICSL